MWQLVFDGFFFAFGRDAKGGDGEGGDVALGRLGREGSGVGEEGGGGCFCHELT